MKTVNVHEFLCIVRTNTLYKYLLLWKSLLILKISCKVNWISLIILRYITLINLCTNKIDTILINTCLTDLLRQQTIPMKSIRFLIKFTFTHFYKTRTEQICKFCLFKNRHTIKWHNKKCIINLPEVYVSDSPSVTYTKLFFNLW